MKRFLAVIAVVGVVVGAYVCGALGRSNVDAVAGGAGWAAVLALGLGIGLGAAYARARRGYEDYRSTKQSVGPLRRGALGLAGVVVKWAAAAAVVAAIALAAAGRG